MSRKKYVIFAFGAVFLVFLYLYSAMADKKENETSMPLAIELSSSATFESVYKTLPIKILIPKIKVNALIEQVGFTAGGAMDTPKNIENAGWFAFGVVPGEIGSAVIDGHYGWKNRKASAFDRLSEVKVGDLVYVSDNNQATTTFIVRMIKDYGPREDTASIFNSTDNLSHLNLITCEGIWSKEKQSYSKRRVVFTDKVIK